MPFIIADRVREISTTVGTGSIALGGAVVGFQTFDAVLDTGDTTYYTFAEQGGPNWEVGIGTFTAPSTLARTTILSSSNAGSIVNFGAGTKNVFITLPASRTNVEDQPNIIEVNSSSPALRINQIGTGNALLVEDSANPDATPFVVDASGNVGVGTTTPTAPLDVNGNVAITGTARRITGDFSNGTFNSRTLFQSSSGTFSDVGVIGPNASQSASWAAYFGNDPANTSRARMLATSVDARFESSATGTGTLLPMTFFTGGSERMRIDASGNVGIGTSSPIGRLSVNLGDASGNVSAWDSTYATFGAAGSTTGKAVGVGFNATSNYGEIRSVEPGVAWRDLYIRGNNLNFYSSISGASVLGMVLNTSGNVGIGTSSPGARLHVSGSSGITTQIIQSTGSVAARFNLQTTNDANGFINYDTGNWIFFNNSAGSAVERMRIDASGNVGIGTSSPTERLDVRGNTFTNGTIRIDKINSALDIRPGSSDFSSLVWRSLDGATTYANIGPEAAGSGSLWLNGATNVYLATGGSERMRITNAGNVGIGTSSPDGRLHARFDAGSGDGFTGRYIFQTTDQRLTIRTYWQSGVGQNSAIQSSNSSNAANNLLLNPDGGNVSIGTSSSAWRFTSVGGSVQLSPGTSAQEGVRLTRSTGVMTFNGINNDNNAYNALAFSTSASEAMRIDTSGNVGIGTSSPGARLDVNSSGQNIVASRSTGGYAAFQRLAPAGQQAYDFYIINGVEVARITADGGNFLAFSNGSAATERFRIGPSGQFGIGGTNYGTSGQVLTSNGAASAPSWQSATATGTLVNVQAFTSSGTYTRTAGVTRAVVIAVGGGGGGGRGSVGSANGNVGGTGGTTSFGSHVTAVGGIGGGSTGNSTIARGGAGGSGGTGALIAIRGGPGINPTINYGGLGGGGGGGSGNGGAGVRGGGGAGGDDTAGIGGGGGGGQGETSIDYISSGLNATETVTIGAGGASAGGTGNIGGAGGAGYIIVYEYS